MSPSRHRWIVDALEEHTATLEVDADAVVRLPRWVLPPDAREGSVLLVKHERDGPRSRLTIDVDDSATRAAVEESKAQLRKAPKGGKGDIDL